MPLVLRQAEEGGSRLHARGLRVAALGVMTMVVVLSFGCGGGGGVDDGGDGAS